MTPLDLVGLTTLMEITSGRSDVTIGLIDGPVAIDHPDIAGENVREIPGRLRAACTIANSAACTHGTFVAGILIAKRNSLAPAISPNCSLLVRPIFAESTLGNGEMPSATPEELAEAVADCVQAGANVINLSAAIAQPSSKGERVIQEALDRAAGRNVIVVAAAGNQGTVGSSAITRHSWAIPVVAYDLRRRPMSLSNLGRSTGRRGLGAPGEDITSLGTTGKPRTFSGTSAAAPFVTGTIALLWSAFPNASAPQIKWAMMQSGRRRASVVPPLLDAWAAYQAMKSS